MNVLKKKLLRWKETEELAKKEDGGRPEILEVAKREGERVMNESYHRVVLPVDVSQKAPETVSPAPVSKEQAPAKFPQPVKVEVPKIS